MSEIFTLVGTFLAGGCCVMLMSGLILIALAIRSKPTSNRARVADPDPPSPSFSLADDPLRPIGRQHGWFD